MPFVEANGLRQYYRLDGNEDRPVVVFSHSLGCDHSMWDAQAAALAPHFRVLRYDTRGHGATDVPGGDYSIEMLAADALALIEALGIDQFAWCGLSLGGMIGQRLALTPPARVTKLILANTSPRVADPSVMEKRRQTALEQGMPSITETAMGRFFMAETLALKSPAAAGIRRGLLATNPAGYAGCCAAIRDMDHTRILRSIRIPTLVISGNYDVSTPWSGHGDVLAREIANAQVERLPTAHLSNLERPRGFIAALFRFLMPQSADTLAAGFERRRAVLGDAHVDRAVDSTTDFTKAFQELITRFAWGTIWQRPGLDDRTRRLLLLAITASLSRWEEFRLHLSAGLAHELETCDVEEALLQIAVYAGVPAANTAFQIANEEITRNSRP
jgi:3-oxoadipate enol-lactonase/4-carboxymuconolactone decarboxylase